MCTRPQESSYHSKLNVATSTTCPAWEQTHTAPQWATSWSKQMHTKLLTWTLNSWNRNTLHAYINPYAYCIPVYLQVHLAYSINGPLLATPSIDYTIPVDLVCTDHSNELMCTHFRFLILYSMSSSDACNPPSADSVIPSLWEWMTTHQNNNNKLPKLHFVLERCTNTQHFWYQVQTTRWETTQAQGQFTIISLLTECNIKVHKQQSCLHRRGWFG